MLAVEWHTGPVCSRAPHIPHSIAGDGVEPRGERPGRVDAVDLSDQRQECGLKRILGVGGKSDTATAHSPDEARVFFNQSLERDRVAVGTEAKQEAGVRILSGVRTGGAEAIDDAVKNHGGHRSNPGDGK